MIKIKTEKQVDKDGNKGRIVMEVTGVISIKDLPYEYAKGISFSTGATEKFYGSAIEFNFPPDKGLRLDKNKFIFEDEFQKKLEYIKMACDRLHEINQKIRQMKEEWKGEETFVV